MLVASTAINAQLKDTANLPAKNEKTEIKNAGEQRVRLEKEQLIAKPELVFTDKGGPKQKYKKLSCKSRVKQ